MDCYKQQPALSAVYSGLTRVPIHGCSSCAPCPTASAHTQTHSNLLTTPVMTTTTTSTPHLHNLQTPPALRRPHQQPVETSRIPHSHPSPMLLNSVTCVSSLHARSDVALVPCGHSRFCGNCADTVAAIDSGCPLCRTPILMVLRVFN